MDTAPPAPQWNSHESPDLKVLASSECLNCFLGDGGKRAFRRTAEWIKLDVVTELEENVRGTCRVEEAIPVGARGRAPSSLGSHCASPSRGHVTSHGKEFRGTPTENGKTHIF